MKTVKFVTPFFLAVVLVFAGCGRSDQQITSDVQSKINSDSNVQNKQISVSADKGVVTLSGTVTSDLERQAAANDAGQVSGVKTVLNNLEVANAAAAQNAPSTEAETVPSPRSQASPSISRHKRHNTGTSEPSYSENSARANESTASVAPSAPATPPAPPAPVTVTIPEGTPVSVVLTDPLSSETNHVGDTFRASLEAPLVADNDRVAIPAGSEVDGHIVAVQPSTHFSGHSLLTVQLDKAIAGGKTYTLATNQWSKQGAARGKRTAETIGGGAGLGALIGAIAGGGKGAAIGAGVGAAAGTGVQGITHGEAVRLPSETRLDFRLEQPLTVTQTSTPQREVLQQQP
jgi:hypothetical protein